MARWETEVVVAGTGPGGATLARELAGKGRSVVMVELGRWHEWPVGRLISMGAITRPIRSRQGGFMARGITVGGSSMVYNGNAFDPPSWLGPELGIDLSRETAATKKELGIRVLPEEFYRSWPATRRLVEAAGSLDIALRAQPKFINPDKCRPGCDDCMFGCRRGAKWTTRAYVREAMDNGARLLSRTRAERVVFDRDRAVGLKVSGPHEVHEVRAEKTVLAAGGIGTPLILQQSGIRGAGQGFFIDPMNVALGLARDKGTWHEMSFAFASEEFVESEGFLVGTVGAFMAWAAQLVRPDRLRALFRAHELPRLMGMFTKIGDTPGGRLGIDGSIDKPYPAEDEEKFRKGTRACKQILTGAGADPASIMVAHDIGGHPGGAAAVGKVVDNNLEAYEAKNLFVCDASIFPRSPGRPPTLTLIALAKWLAARI